MTFSEYARLEPTDVFQKGDEIRVDTPYSSLSQHVDMCLDEGRREWGVVSSYWVGRSVAVFLKGMTRFGKVDIRRHVGSTTKVEG